MPFLFLMAFQGNPHNGSYVIAFITVKRHIVTSKIYFIRCLFLLFTITTLIAIQHVSINGGLVYVVTISFSQLSPYLSLWPWVHLRYRSFIGCKITGVEFIHGLQILRLFRKNSVNFKIGGHRLSTLVLNPLLPLHTSLFLALKIDIAHRCFFQSR